LRGLLIKPAHDGPAPNVHRRISCAAWVLLPATALNMSNMVGVGPFITIPILMGTVNGGGPQAMLGGWWGWPSPYRTA
jgi:hypothetical protein